MRRLLVCCVALFALPVVADDLSTLTLFRTGVYSDNVGTANLAIGDVTGDGVADIVSCSQGSAFVVTRSGAAMAPGWFSEPTGCSAVTLGDTNGDGAPEIIVGTNAGASSAGSILIYDPSTLGPARRSVLLPINAPVSDVAIGDVDGDGKAEVVAVTSANAYVYDAATLTLEWTALGKGGSKIALGDLEGDGGIEIVVNGSPGHVLDAHLQYEKWGYSGGFGRSFAVGDVDQDGKAEIAFLSAGYDVITIIDGDTFATSTVSATEWVDRIAIADGNGDGAAELILGNNQWGDIVGIRRSNGQVLYRMYNPEHGTMAVAAGDVDGDGVPEVIWGAGATSSGADVLFTASAATQTIKWRSPDLDGEYGGAVADLDGDGKLELIVKMTQSESGYAGGIIQVYDLATRVLKASVGPTNRYSGPTYSRVTVAQMDGDAALEIIVLGSSSIYVFDGVTLNLEYQSPYGAAFSMAAVYAGNIDSDATTEIVVGTNDQKVEVLNGASSFIQWSSPALDGYVTDIAVADLDHDGVQEIVVTTTAGVYVFNAVNGTERWHASLGGGFTHVAATADGSGYFSVTGPSVLRVYSGVGTLSWECTNTAASAVAFAKLDGELRVVTGDSAGNLRFYPVTGNSCPVPLMRNVSRASIAGIRSYETTGDTTSELLLSYSYSIELQSLSLSRYARGDFDGDGVVADADIDALALYLYGGGPGAPPAADVNSDGTVSGDDLFYLINYRKGTGAAPPP